MPHISPTGRKSKTFAPLIAVVATLVAVSLGLMACGGSSSTTTTTTTANAAATGATTSTGTTSTQTSSTGTSSTGTTTPASPTTGTSAAARAARLAAVRTCLSKKGIAVPQGAGGLGGAQLPKGMSRAQFVEALNSCGTGFKNGGRGLGSRGKGFKNPFKSARFHAVLARFSACLRQQGVDVGEPNTSGKGPIFDTKGINTGSPKFKAATAACRKTLLYALRPKQAHPGTAGKAEPSG